MEQVSFKIIAIDALNPVLEEASGHSLKLQSQFGVLNRKIGSMNKPLISIGDKFKMTEKRGVSFFTKMRSGISSFLSRLGPVGGMIAGAFALDRIRGFIGSIADTRAEFQRYEAVLENTLGSKGASKRVLADIVRFASQTPNQVNELTASWVKMANQGFRPTMDEMRKLGDLAAAQAKPIEQLAEAVLDAQVGEFERLKEFGIRAQKQGDMVTFTFKGQQKQVQFTDRAIQDYLLSLGDLQGVQGGMSKIMETQGGKVSNNRDKMMLWRLEIANATGAIQDMFVDKIGQGIDFLRRLTQWVIQNKDRLLELATTVVTVGTKVLAMYAAFRIGIGIASMIKSIQMAWVAVTTVLKLARIGMIAFNIAALANPFVWIPIVLVGVAALLTNFGGFRDRVLGWFTDIWTKIKNFANFMLMIGKIIWKHHPFRWMINLINKVFPQFKASLRLMFKWIMDLFKKAFDWVKKKVLQPIAKWFGKIFNFDFNLGLSGKLPGLPGSGDDPKLTDDDADIYGRVTSDPGASPGKNARGRRRSVTSGIGGISGGGSIKNIIVNIDKLIDEMIINTASLPASTALIQREVANALTAAVNDINQ